MTIDVNGCWYTFTPRTIEDEKYEGHLDIMCPSETKIEVTAPGCTVTIGPQFDVKGVTFTNIGSGSSREITADLYMTGIAYEEHKVGVFPTCKDNTVLKKNGVYIGAAKVKGETKAGAQLGIFVNEVSG